MGIIPQSFPTIGAAISDPAANAVEEKEPETENVPEPSTAPCGCPTRTLPPPLPTTCPFPPVEENRDNLLNWIKSYYSASTLNTCPHQPLPPMEGPPVQLMITPDAVPIVHHNPIPIALHWQEEVYILIMQDVAMGVLEPVPVGTPVTWCHLMIIVRKKDGSIRRVVDLTGLNKYVIRETHHTMSPFHQATLIPPNTKKDSF